MKRSTMITTVALALASFGLGVAPVIAQQQAASSKPPVLVHDLEGRSACLMCHTPGAMEPVPDAPASHEGRPNESCLWCHAKDAGVQAADPPAISHELEGRNACLMCHTPGAMEPVPDAPANHKPFTDKYCGLCHKPAS